MSDPTPTPLTSIERIKACVCHWPGVGRHSPACGTHLDEVARLLAAARAAGYREALERESPTIHLTGEHAENLGFLIGQERNRERERITAAVEAVLAHGEPVVITAGHLTAEMVDVELIRAALARPACCDLHGRNCEPPSELCCSSCTEVAHPLHRDGSTCSNPDLSGSR
jgi:hypothetical protein